MRQSRYCCNCCKPGKQGITATISTHRRALVQLLGVFILITSRTAWHVIFRRYSLMLPGSYVAGGSSGLVLGGWAIRQLKSVIRSRQPEELRLRILMRQQ